MEILTNKINATGGILTAFFIAVFGPLWFLFMGFLLLNVIDWITGWWAARKERKESSAVGLKGILKKMVYWIVIAIAFYIAFAFQQMGKMIGIELSFLNMIGWFVLANFIVNEIRSILENAVRIDTEAVPYFLIKGLKVTSELLEAASNEKFFEEEKK